MPKGSTKQRKKTTGFTPRRLKGRIKTTGWGDQKPVLMAVKRAETDETQTRHPGQRGACVYEPPTQRTGRSLQGGQKTGRKTNSTAPKIY